MNNSHCPPNYRRILLTVLALVLATSPAWAQLGGQQAFPFLLLPATPRQVALGAYNIASNQQDANAWLGNTALLADSAAGKLGLFSEGYYASTQMGSLSYAHPLKFGTAGLGVRYFHYGDIQGYNASGQFTGTFSASDYAISLAFAQQWGIYSGGIALQYIQSGWGGSRYIGLALDAGGAFKHPERDFRIGFSVRNLGAVLTRTVSTFNMPLQVQLGTAFKPEHLPVRLSLTLHHLQRFQLLYSNTSGTGLLNPDGTPIVENISFANQLLSHVALGGELLLGKYVNLRLGYNLLDRKSLALSTAPRTVGFSWGIMIQTKKLRLEFSRGNRFAGGGYSSIGLSFSPKQLFLKKKVISTN